MPFVTHIWKPTRQETRCGLWFKCIPSLEKPNLVSALIAIKLWANNLGGILCKNCVKSAASQNSKLFPGFKANEN